MKKIIKYNEESYKWAKKTLFPDLEFIKDKTGKVNVPDLCRMAGAKLLTELPEYDHGMHYTHKYAYHVISSFSQQLDETGVWEFGNENILDIVPEKHLT